MPRSSDRLDDRHLMLGELDHAPQHGAVLLIPEAHESPGTQGTGPVSLPGQHMQPTVLVEFIEVR